MKTVGQHSAFPLENGSVGLTKLEYFSAMFMQAFIARGNDKLNCHELAVEQAYKLINELNAQQAKEDDT